MRTLLLLAPGGATLYTWAANTTAPVGHGWVVVVVGRTVVVVTLTITGLDVVVVAGAGGRVVLVATADVGGVVAIVGGTTDVVVMDVEGPAAGAVWLVAATPDR